MVKVIQNGPFILDGHQVSFLSPVNSKGTLIQRIKCSVKPIDWGPAKMENRILWEDYKKNCTK